MKKLWIVPPLVIFTIAPALCLALPNVCVAVLVDQWNQAKAAKKSELPFGNRPITELQISAEAFLTSVGVQNLDALVSKSSIDLMDLGLAPAQINEISIRLSAIGLGLKTPSTLTRLAQMPREKKLSQPILMLEIDGHDFQGRTIDWLVSHGQDMFSPQSRLFKLVQLRLIEAGIMARSWSVFGERIDYLRTLPLESLLEMDVDVIYFPKWLRDALEYEQILTISDLVSLTPEEIDRRFQAHRGLAYFKHLPNGQSRPIPARELIQSRLEEIGLRLAPPQAKRRQRIQIDVSRPDNVMVQPSRDIPENNLDRS